MFDYILKGDYIDYMDYAMTLLMLISFSCMTHSCHIKIVSRLNSHAFYDEIFVIKKIKNVCRLKEIGKQ